MRSHQSLPNVPTHTQILFGPITHKQQTFWKIYTFPYTVAHLIWSNLHLWGELGRLKLWYNSQFCWFLCYSHLVSYFRQSHIRKLSCFHVDNHISTNSPPHFQKIINERVCTFKNIHDVTSMMKTISGLLKFLVTDYCFKLQQSHIFKIRTVAVKTEKLQNP